MKLRLPHFAMCLLALVITFIPFILPLGATGQSSTDILKRRFTTPPASAKPEVWWHWMSGNVTKDGAELDLAWMKRVGIGGVHIFSGGSLEEPLVVSPSVPFMSDAWKGIFHDAVLTARADRIVVTIAGSPGWSETGGTWVTPEQAMKKYVWSETKIDGEVPFDGKLLTPSSLTGPFQNLKSDEGVPSDLTHDVYVDALVVAFPTPASERSSISGIYSASSFEFDLLKLTSEGFERPVSLAPSDAMEGEKPWIQVDFGTPTFISAVTIGLASRANLHIESSEDGILFKSVLEVPADQVRHHLPK